jgi:hypothetical protein
MVRTTCRRCSGTGLPPDDPVPPVAISRSGVEAAGLDASYGPAELLAAWQRRI